MVWTQSSFPLLIVTSGSGFTGLFVYSPIPGTGNLLASVTAQAGTDPYGNPYQASITAYQLGLPRVNTRLSAGAVIFNRGAVVNSAAVVGSNDSAALVLSSGQVNASDIECILVLGPALAGAVPVALLTGALELEEGAVPAADGSITAGPKLFGTTGGHAGVVDDTRNGDGVAYQLGENVQFNTAAVPIPASGFTAVFSQAVAVGSYRFDGKMRLKQGAIGGIPGNIGFTGPATSFGLYDAFWSLQGATTTFNSTATTSFGTQLNVLGSQPVAGNEVVAWFRGTVTFTAAGTLTIGCQADGTHPFTAQAGCEFSVRRVS
jgi:hypothetical protein